MQLSLKENKVVLAHLAYAGAMTLYVRYPGTETMPFHIPPLMALIP